jgi:hypothetical protein
MTYRDDYGRPLKHQTSIDGYQDVKYRAGSQKAKLLAAFAAIRTGLTSEEAFDIAQLHPRAEFWARCTELEADGLIELYRRNNVQVTRPSRTSGNERNVYRITYKGLVVAGRSMTSDSK